MIDSYIILQHFTLKRRETMQSSSTITYILYEYVFISFWGFHVVWAQTFSEYFQQRRIFGRLLGGWSYIFSLELFFSMRLLYPFSVSNFVLIILYAIADNRRVGEPVDNRWWRRCAETGLRFVGGRRIIIRGKWEKRPIYSGGGGGRKVV